MSDSTTNLESKLFIDFCTNNGIIQTFIAQGHLFMNGLAERYVQTVMAKLKAIKDELSIYIKVQEILLRYKATPLANEKSLA